MEKIHEILSFFRKSGVYPDFLPVQSASTEPEVKIDGKEYLMFCSNNYLGLATHPKVIAGAEKELRKHGTGPGGSRLLCGNIDLLMEVDRKLASLVNKEAAITFPTGFMANLSPFKAILDPFMENLPAPAGSSVIFADKFNHASLVDGCALSSAKLERFKHNSVNHLEAKLKKYSYKQRKMIVIDGVFSMDADFAPLSEITALAKKYNAFLMVDEAHSIGVIGPNGSGVCSLLKTTDKTDIIMGACDKALGATGGFLAGSKELIDYLRAVSRPYTFSSAMPAVMAGGILAAVEIIQSSEGEIIRNRLFENAKYLRNNLSGIGATILGQREVPVIPLLVGEEALTVQVAKRLLAQGIFCSPVIAPAVPKGTGRIRLTPMATHTKEHLDTLLNIVNDVFKELKVKVQLPKEDAV